MHILKPKEADMVILISNKIDFRAGITARERERGRFHNDEVIHPTEIYDNSKLFYKIILGEL